MTETQAVSQAVSMDDVRALVKERQQYDDWLAALESRRAETPAQVFTRVHADYVGRRSAVLDRLDTHVESMTALRDQLTARLQALDVRLAAREDERAEALLRTAVGEYDVGRAEEVRKTVEDSIESIEGERGVLVTEVDELQDLLSHARTLSTTTAEFTATTPTFTASAELPLMEVDFDDELDDFVAPVSLPPETRTPTAPRAGIADANIELEDALSMFSPTDEPDLLDATPAHSFRAVEPPAPRAAPAADAGFAAAPTATKPFDEMAFLRSVIDPSTAGGNARTAANGTQQKSLRCTECGTMNFPTEWYCERCGGELAAF